MKKILYYAMCIELCLAVDVGLICATVVNSAGFAGVLIAIGGIMFIDSGVIILF